MGMRWICKQLKDLSKKKWPNADRYQIGSLIGGYIYLRFFNPVIVTPDYLGFVDVKPAKHMRRNLILLAKVLQNISNGILFGDKESYMGELNKFVLESREPLQDYFDKLVCVENLDEKIEIDQFFTSQLSSVQLTLNQIF